MVQNKRMNTFIKHNSAAEIEVDILNVIQRCVSSTSALCPPRYYPSPFDYVQEPILLLP